MKLHHFRPKKEKRGLLYQVFILVAVLQISLLIGLSGYIVSQSIIEDEQRLDAPPPVEKVQVAQKEHRVRVERQQKKSRKMNKRIQVANPQNVNAPEVKVTIPASISTGAGISTISDKAMTGGLKLAVPTVEIGGIKSKTEKVLICVDAGPYLMTDERGGLDTYKVIREDIKRLVNTLPSTMLFNLMAFDISNGAQIKFFQGNLVAATAFNKRIACDWVDPINVALNKTGVSAVRGPYYKFKYEFLKQPPASQYYNPYVSNIYRVYQAALEQGADTIYILTTGWVDPDKIKLPWTDAETERFRRAMEKYEDQVAKARKQQGWTDEKQQEFETADALARQKGIKKAREWIKQENAKRAQKGVPLYTGTPSKAMYENKFYVRPQPSPPAVKVPRPEAKFKPYGRVGIMRYYNKLFKEVYFDKKMKPPVVNMIVFRGAKEEWTPAENKVVRQFTNANNGGRSRILKGLKSVKEYE